MMYCARNVPYAPLQNWRERGTIYPKWYSGTQLIWTAKGNAITSGVQPASKPVFPFLPESHRSPCEGGGGWSGLGRGHKSKH